MVDTIESGSLKLSAADLKHLTDWPDPLIEDYLSLTRTITQTIVVINTSTEIVTEVQSDLGTLRGLFNGLTKEVQEINELVAQDEIAHQRAKLNGEVKRLDNALQWIAMNNELLSFIQSRVNYLEQNLSLPSTIAARISLRA